jgi:uncharacterized protein (TIGR02301 family)
MMRALPLPQLRRALICGAALALALAPGEVLAQDFFSDLFGGFESRPWRSAPPRYRAEPGRARPPRRHETRPRDQTKEQNKTAPRLAPNAASEPAKAGAEPPPPPYDAEVQRLAEILGGLSYLRDLCGAGDGEEWRKKMAQLRDADAPTGSRRARLTAAFNRGFKGYELTYRACTPNARLVIARYLNEAERVASTVATRYGAP